MANRYWVGGTASWDATAGTKWALTSGGTGGEAVPTSADDVFFDGNSGVNTVTISASVSAKSLTCTGFTGTLTGSTGALSVSGNITLAAGMTFSFNQTTSVVATATITSAGKTFGAFSVSATGGTVTLADALSVTGTLSVSTGTFNTAGYNVTCNFFNSSSAGNTRAVTLGASTVTVTGLNLALDFSGSGLTFTANTSTINFTGGSAQINFGNLTYNNVAFTATTPSSTKITFDGSSTFANLTFPANSSSTQTFLFDISGNQTITGTLTLSAGGNATRRTILRSNTPGTARTLTVNALAAGAADYDFADITVAGAAAPISGTRFGDCKGNSGITFDAAKTVYWNLAGTNNITATGWAPTSGGTPAINNFPLAQDTAVINNSSAGATITFVGGSVPSVAGARPGFNIGTLDASGRTSALTITGSSFCSAVYGNLQLGSGISFGGTGSVIIFSGRVTQDILTSGVTVPTAISVYSPGGTVRLLDAITISLATSATLAVFAGTFTANNYNVTATGVSASGSLTRTVTMGSGLWTLSGTGTVWDFGTTTGLTFNKDTANILLSSTSTSARTFAGGGLTYNKLTIGGATGTSTLTISGTNTFSELASTKTAAHTITLTAGTTTTTAAWTVTGSAGNVVTLNSSSSATAATLTLTGGGYLTGINYLNVQSVQATPISDTWYIGATSVYNTTAPNLASGFFTTQRSANAVIVLTSTSSTTWTVPGDWDSASNTIHIIGGGGGGGGCKTGLPRSSGAGGGGGGYTKLTNQTLTPGASITYQCGSGGTGGASGGSGTNGTAGGTTSWNSGAATAGGGGGGGGGTATTSTGGTAGTGTTFNGGAGGAGNVGDTNPGGGGGGGAGGPNGAGGSGGSSAALGNTGQGAGGGGNGGGTAGAATTVSPLSFGAGGNNFAGVGGATTANTSGAVGGGAAGINTSGTSLITLGGNGVDVFGVGSGGGGGGLVQAISVSSTRTGGFYGGGGSGGGINGGNSSATGAAGSQGAIIIVYGSGIEPSTGGGGNFLMFFFN